MSNEMESDDSLTEEKLLNEIISEVKWPATPKTAGDAQAMKDIHPVVRQQLQQPRCKSNIWIYFERLGTGLAKCRICQNNYRFGSSISNLRNHAEVKHREILRQGPEKFLEKLKVPKEHVKKLIHPDRKSVKESGGYSNWPHRRKKHKSYSKETSNNDDGESFYDLERVKREIEQGDGNSTEYDERNIKKALESIYQDSEDTINNYMESPSNDDNLSHINAEFERPDSPNQDFAMQNGQAGEDDDLNFSGGHLNFDARDQMSIFNDPNLQRLKEERIRAETNYFNKKAAFMERNADYVTAQRQLVLLQAKKLKLEIAAMRQSFTHS